MDMKTLNVVYNFDATHTTLDVLGMRLIYVLPENVHILRNALYDHAFILCYKKHMPINWRKIKDENRKKIHPTFVGMPISYLSGCSLLLPRHIEVTRDEVQVSIDGTVVRLFTHSIGNRVFVPHHLADKVVTTELLQDRPLLDVTTMRHDTSRHTIGLLGA